MILQSNTELLYGSFLAWLVHSSCRRPSAVGTYLSCHLKWHIIDIFKEKCSHERPDTLLADGDEPYFEGGDADLYPKSCHLYLAICQQLPFPAISNFSQNTRPEKILPRLVLSYGGYSIRRVQVPVPVVTGIDE